MAGKQITHKDRLDQDLAVGDCVAYPSGNSLVIGVITKFNPKMIKVSKLPAGRFSWETNKYPVDLIKLDSSAVTMYLLKNQVSA